MNRRVPFGRNGHRTVNARSLAAMESAEGLELVFLLVLTTVCAVVLLKDPHRVPPPALAPGIHMALALYLVVAEFEGDLVFA